MNEKLKECLLIVDEICSDVSEAYPCGLLRVRRLLREALAADKIDAVDGGIVEMMELTENPLEGKITYLRTR